MVAEAIAAKLLEVHVSRARILWFHWMGSALIIPLRSQTSLPSTSIASPRFSETRFPVFIPLSLSFSRLFASVALHCLSAPLGSLRFSLPRCLEHLLERARSLSHAHPFAWALSSFHLLAPLSM